MRKIPLVIGAAAFAACAHAGVAQAQAYTNYPFCAVYEPSVESCAFNTMQQCMMSISGRGGYCIANPYFQPPKKKPRR